MYSKLTTLFVTLTFLVTNNVHSQQLTTLASEVYKSYDELKDAYENLSKVQSIVKDIEKGDKPNIASYGSDWAPLANRYKNAAQTIKKSKLITDFNATPYSVSINDLNNCYIKDKNFSKLKKFKSELDSAVVRGQKELVDINDYKNLIEKTFTALNYLIEVNKKLSSIPIYNQIFQWNWFDLDRGVHPALGDLSTAITEHEKKLKQELAKISTQSNNLGSNITLLENSLCNLNGPFKGDCTFSDSKVTNTGNITITIKKVGNLYTGNFHVATKDYANDEIIPSIIITDNKYIVFYFKDKWEQSGNYRGELNENYTKILNFRADGYSGTCILSK